MPDKIEISVTVNGRPGSLADVSLETLQGLRSKTQPTVKPIEHGDYGHTPQCHECRVFIKRGEFVGSYDSIGRCIREDANHPDNRHWYTITGNIFKDLQNGS